MLLSAHGVNSHSASEPSSPEDRVVTETFKQHTMRQVLIKFGGGKELFKQDARRYILRSPDVTQSEIMKSCQRRKNPIY